MRGPGGMNGAADFTDGTTAAEMAAEAMTAAPADLQAAADGAAGSDGTGSAPAMAEGTGQDGSTGAPAMAEGASDSAAAQTASTSGDEMVVGTPEQGTTQASGSSTNSNNYASYDEMLAAYEADIASIEAGDKYGNNLVDLYNPLNYIGAEDTEDPVWTRILMGASEGDMSMFSSLQPAGPCR